jgi:hypothetical protein
MSKLVAATSTSLAEATGYVTRPASASGNAARCWVSNRSSMLFSTSLLLSMRGSSSWPEEIAEVFAASPGDDLFMSSIHRIDTNANSRRTFRDV